MNYIFIEKIRNTKAKNSFTNYSNFCKNGYKYIYFIKRDKNTIRQRRKKKNGKNIMQYEDFT